MNSYAVWNNKGGVGKSFLTFVTACEYARLHPDTDVYVIDLCPQASVSEIFLAGTETLNNLFNQVERASVAGYLEARLNSPFRMIQNVSPYLCHPQDYNENIPSNIYLICGDHLLEIISGAIRQVSVLAFPTDAWKQVISWVKDLKTALCQSSGNRETLFLTDCSPVFAIYTQLALVAADYLIVPFTADNSSRHAIENVVALLYGYGVNDPKRDIYAKINFSQKAKDYGVDIPKVHTFVMRETNKRASDAIRIIRQTMDDIHKKHRSIYATPKELPSDNFIELPDCHSVCVIASATGTPIHILKPGSINFGEGRVQINKASLERYKAALTRLVNCL